MAHSYDTTEDSLRALRLVLYNERTEFTIHVRNDVLVLSVRLYSTSPEDMSSISPKFVLRNTAYFGRPRWSRGYHTRHWIRGS